MADSFAMGAGHINPGGKTIKGSAFEPGLAYDAGYLEYLGFLCDAAPEVFYQSICIPTEAYNLNLPSIGVAELPGCQTVYRVVTSVAKESGWREYTVSINPPPGYEVTVSPSTLRLKKGDTATYAVTITNVGAPVGEWCFGSLTWSDKTGHYDVYSPIAVRASMFKAPAEVSGTGTEGCLSFDVRRLHGGPARSRAGHGYLGQCCAGSGSEL